jgi:phosphoglucomutase
MKMAVELAKNIDADIVFASDPDADRVGVAVKRPDGEWMLLNGNQTMSVLIYYLLKEWKETGRLTGKEFIVKTIVTSELPADIAKRVGVKVYDVLTGFKFIGDKIRELEGKEVFIGGGEESYGYMIGDFVRDKDAVAACSMIAEIAAWAAEQGKTFFDVLVDLYTEYGFYKEGLLSVVRKGKSGAEEIVAMMKNFRENPQKEIAGSPVVTIKDFQSLEELDVKTGKITKLEMPATSNVLQYYTEDGTKVSIRPSGTEPKIKFYIEVHDKLDKAENYDAKNEWADQKIDRICHDLGI